MGIRQQTHHFTGAQRTGGRAVEWTGWWLRESFHWGAKVWKPDQSYLLFVWKCGNQIGRGNRLSDPCTSGGGDHQCSTSPWLKAMAVKAALQEVETPLVWHSAWVQILGVEVHAFVSGIITIQIEIDRNNIKYNPNIYAISFLCICGQAQGHGIRRMSCYTYCLPGILIDVLRVLGQWSGMRMSPSQMLIYFTGRCYGIERNCL